MDWSHVKYLWIIYVKYILFVKKYEWLTIKRLNPQAFNFNRIFLNAFHKLYVCKWTPQQFTLQLKG